MKRRMFWTTALTAAIMAWNAVCGMAATNERTADLITDYLAGMEAAQNEDWDTYAEHMLAILELEPGHPAVVRHLARAYANLGRTDDALDCLERVAETGADLNLADDEHFAGLKSSKRFAKIIARVAELKLPMGAASEAFRIPMRPLLPEGIAYDPAEDVFYLGSIHQRKILRIQRDGTYEDFTTVAADGMLGVLGLRVLPERRELWAVTAGIAGMNGLTDANEGASSVHRYSLETGELIQAYRVSNEDAKHNFNDIVVAADGRAYITDALSGALYTVDPKSNVLGVLHGPGTFSSPNGLALSPDGSLLYIAQYGVGVALMDTGTLEADILPHPESAAPVGIDGMYYRQGALIAVQNYLGMQQVTRFELRPDGRAITAAVCLERQHPSFEDPTTAAIAGDHLFIVANSQLPRLGEDGAIPGPEAFEDSVILKIRL